MAVQTAAQANAPDAALAIALAPATRAIDAGNRARHARQLMQMHADRKTVFVDRLHWELPVTQDHLEIDAYDREDTIYLMVLDKAAPGTGAHLGSVRLLPTLGPHLLGDVFPHLCEAGVPRGPDIWEITRLVTNPALPPLVARRVRQQLAVAIAEFAVARSIRHFTMMTHMQYLPAVMAMGWDCEPLGMPQEMDGVGVAALRVDVDATTLARFRAQFRIGGPLLRFPPDKIGTGDMTAF